MMDDIESMELSSYLCILTSAGLMSIESSQNIYVPIGPRLVCLSYSGVGHDCLGKYRDKLYSV